MDQKLFVRNFATSKYLDVFFVSSVFSFFILRILLQLTNYPQLATEVLHISHVLWGGLFMMVSIVMLIAFLDKLTRYTAVIVGGLGFGIFIDELGKIITRDYDYFYEPAIALIYVVFILMYFAFRAIGTSKNPTESEYLVNALELGKEVVVFDFEAEEKRKALGYVSKTDATRPVVKQLKLFFSTAQTTEVQMSLIEKLQHLALSFYRKLISYAWFSYGVIIFFIVKSIISLVQAIIFVQGIEELVISALAAVFFVEIFYTLYALISKTGSSRMQYLRAAMFVTVAIFLVWIGFSRSTQTWWSVLSFSQWGSLISSAVSSAIAFYGVFQFIRSRIVGFRLFKLSVLLSILLAQFFAFYQDQLSAVFGLLLNILVLLTLNYVIALESEVRHIGIRKSL